MVNSSLDQLYADVIIFGLLGMITGRNWSLMVMMHKSGYVGRLSVTYLCLFIDAVALLMSVGMFVTLLIQFGYHGSLDLISQMDSTFRFFTRLLLGIHLLLIPYFTYMLYWLWAQRGEGIYYGGRF